MVQNRKLSPKNAFTSVDMDAALAELRGESRNRKEVNFSMLGLSLDASSRVYGCRVENTYLSCMNFAANFRSCVEPDGRADCREPSSSPEKTNGLEDGALDEKDGLAKRKRRRVCHSEFDFGQIRSRNVHTKKP